MDSKENLPISTNNVDEFDLNWWVRHRERTLEHKWYAIGRMDLLIISISGGGLYIVFEILKFLKTSNLTVDTELLKISGIAFTTAIVINFLSQLSGYYANKYEARWARMKISETRNQPFDKNEMLKVDLVVDFFNKVVSIANGISILALVAGVIILTIFNYANL